ncbi:Na/Pi cotransporter family protein [Helicobacter himalayensis]|uniref:Na/Pi cotransporter family protein n=1 Tax=Helicobacter himalayensis TaxID=1591088 RepID=UPI003D6F63B0
MKENLRNLARHSWLPLVCAVAIYLMSTNASLTEILAGVGIFLFGMIFLENGFKGFSGGLLEKILAKWTNSKLKALLFGIVTTILMQSSTLVTIISISFLSAGLISLAQAIGIVFGANLGTTTGGWIIAGIGMKMDIAKIAMPLIVIAVLLTFQKNKNIKSLGSICAGIGFFFLGIAEIKTGFEGYKSALDLSAYASGGGKDLFIFVMAGILITSIVQSSFATLTIIISALVSNTITYDNALGLVIGTNIGGVVTALVASFGSNIEGKRLAIVNTIFNLIIAAIALIFLDYFRMIVEVISEFTGIKETDYALKIAVFHTFYNVVAVVLMTPYISVFVKFATTFIKSKKPADMDAPLYLNDNIVSYPTTAIEALSNEIKHLYDNVFSVIAHSLGFSRSDICANLTPKELLAKKWYSGEVNVSEAYHHKVKVLFDAIIDFATKAQSHIDDPKFIRLSNEASIAARNLSEATKNMILLEKNIKKYAKSTNVNMAREYNAIRIQIATLLNTIQSLTLLEYPSYEEIESVLKQERKALKKFDKSALLRVEKILREENLSATNATSLLNDIAFASNMGKEIIKAASKIYQITLSEKEQDVFEGIEESLHTRESHRASHKESAQNTESQNVDSINSTDSKNPTDSKKSN